MNSPDPIFYRVSYIPGGCLGFLPSKGHLTWTIAGDVPPIIDVCPIGKG